MSKISCPILGEFEPGSSKAARNRALFEKEAGINLAESSVGDKNKALRAEMVLTALGKASSSIAALKAKANETELNESDLTPLASEIRKLKGELRRVAAKYELVSAKEKQPVKDLAGMVNLIEKFQENNISAEELLKQLEGKGIFEFGS